MPANADTEAIRQAYIHMYQVHVIGKAEASLVSALEHAGKSLEVEITEQAPDCRIRFRWSGAFISR